MKGKKAQSQQNVLLRQFAASFITVFIFHPVKTSFCKLEGQDPRRASCHQHPGLAAERKGWLIHKGLP